jgi:hypothetical protein
MGFDNKILSLFPLTKANLAQGKLWNSDGMAD